MAFSARNSIFASPMLLVLFTDLSLGQSESSLSELLIPVDPNEIYQVLETNRNWFAIERHRYISLRHRFVKVDTSVLRNDRRFTFTPFPDVPHTLIRKESRHKPPFFFWRGEIESPIKDQEELDSFEKADLTYDDIHLSKSEFVKLMRHNLVGVDFTIKTNTRALKQPNTDPTPIVSVEPSSESSEATNSVRRGNVKSVETFVGRLSSGYHDAQYNLAPLPDNPEYYIVYEVDKGKSVAPDSPGGREAANEYREFLKALKQERARRKEMGN